VKKGNRYCAIGCNKFKSQQMKITTINYQKVFPLGQYINERLGIEIEVSELDDPLEVYKEAKRIIEEAHRAMNPQLEYESIPSTTQPPIPEQKPQPEERRIGNIVEDINSCENLKVLETYKFIAKQKPEFQEAYEKKFRELSNQ
jgi:hypothetical protein